MLTDGKPRRGVDGRYGDGRSSLSTLAGQLPKDYERFEGDLLGRLLRMFDSKGLRTASGDVFAASKAFIDWLPE